MSIKSLVEAPCHFFEFSLTREPLGASRFDFLTTAGADIQFQGVVRDLEEGKPISGIEYSAYEPMAERCLTEIGAEARAKFALQGLEIRHRIGFVRAGESSLLLRVAMGHSAEAFEASQWCLKQVKTRVPIWKKPVFVDIVPNSAEIVGANG